MGKRQEEKFSIEKFLEMYKKAEESKPFFNKRMV